MSAFTPPKLPATVEEAVEYLRCCEQMTAISANVTADARQHMEMLLRQRRPKFVIVGGAERADGGAA